MSACDVCGFPARYIVAGVCKCCGATQGLTRPTPRGLELGAL